MIQTQLFRLASSFQENCGALLIHVLLLKGTSVEVQELLSKPQQHPADFFLYLQLHLTAFFSYLMASSKKCSASALSHSRRILAFLGPQDSFGFQLSAIFSVQSSPLTIQIE